MRRNINHTENIGKKFNRLLVLDVKKKHYGKKTTTWAYYYECKCDCGNVKDVRAEYVIDGLIKSCGCYQKERINGELIEQAKQMGLKNRKHENKCECCGKASHYALGYCHNCWSRLHRNGDLEYHRAGRKNDRKSNQIN